MSLMEHLEELRKRILWSLLGVGLLFFPCWSYSREIFAFLVAPIQRYLPPGTKLVYLKLTEPFILYFKVAGLAALFLASPFVLYQIWRFISPGLYERERRYALPFVFFTTFFFLAGGAFGYYVAFPYAAQFLLGVGKDLTPVITVDNYFGFLITVLLGLGLMFELPVLIFLLSVLGVVTPRFLMRQFRWAVVIIFTVAAIVTPTPDIFNQCVFAIPGVLLYLLGVGAAALVVRKKKPEAT
ncbi:MAG TPA: twin-arginine translocase subunit TatC [Thermoanaerobaculia bacterium]|nr:twin-arginine translocase subunit TatC [Thermoanaerobaculia bacterium]